VALVSAIHWALRQIGDVPTSPSSGLPRIKVAVYEIEGDVSAPPVLVLELLVQPVSAKGAASAKATAAARAANRDEKDFIGQTAYLFMRAKYSQKGGYGFPQHRPEGLVLCMNGDMRVFFLCTGG
jgi:hypothetical protein